MSDLEQKLEYLQWLNTIGIEYYYSDKKASTKSLLEKISSKKPQVAKIQKGPIATLQPQTIEKYREKKLGNTDSRELANQATSIEDLRLKVSSFDGCELKKFATNTVFADGNANAQVLLIGEAPGASEDELGLPFCGQSGVLLDKIMASINLSRQKNLYITNTIFWRPPANRRPSQLEIEICKPFVEKHIALIKPKLIILVGATAANALLGQGIEISKLRHDYYSYTNVYLDEPITTAAIFHPAYLLRQPNKKKDTWFDLLKIQQLILETK